MSTSDFDDDYPDGDADFEWHEPEDDPPVKTRRRAAARGRSRRGGGRGRGGGFSIPEMNPRLIGLLVGAVVLVVVIALAVRNCQRDQLVDSYKSYVANSTTIITDSANQGEELRTTLSNNQRQGPQQLQTKVRQLANQSNALTESARDLDPPGKMNAAHNSLITVLEYRTNGLSGLADDLPDLINSNRNATVANGIAEQMQRFLASDVIYDDSFVGPAKIALEEDNIVDVEIPEGDDFHFLPGNTTRLASSTGAQSLVPRIKANGGGNANQGGTDDQDGTLRGLGIISVEASPAGTALSTSSETSVSATDLVWRVTVENGGDFEQTAIPVTVTLEYPGNPDDTITAERQIEVIQSKEEQVLEIPLSETPRLGESGTLTVNVTPVDGETSIENNTAVYPVKITI